MQRREVLKNIAGWAMGMGTPLLFQDSDDNALLSSNGSVITANPYINVQDYGAIGDGVTDDTTSFQNALTVAGNAGGGIVIAPRGNYRINGTLTIPGYVTLEGVFTSPTSWSQNKGTTLLAYSGRGSSSGTPFIRLGGHSSGVKGLVIYYPEQNTPSAIVPYPWTIRGGNSSATFDNLSVQNILLVNSYQGVDFSTNQCGRHFIKGLYGQPLKTGIQIDKCFDVGRIENVHFWPFWSVDALPYMATTVANARALVLKRSDWQIVHNFFAFGYHVGVQFLQGEGGLGTNGQFSNLNLDAVNNGLDIYSTQDWGISISNLNITCVTEYGQDVRLGIWAHNTSAPIGPLNITNASFWGSFAQEIIRWEKGGPLQMVSSIFRAWGGGYPAVKITGGRSIICSNTFPAQIGKSIYIGSGAQQVIVTSNQLSNNPVENYGGSTIIANNL